MDGRATALLTDTAILLTGTAVLLTDTAVLLTGTATLDNTLHGLLYYMVYAYI